MFPPKDVTSASDVSVTGIRYRPIRNRFIRDTISPPVSKQNIDDYPPCLRTRSRRPEVDKASWSLRRRVK